MRIMNQFRGWLCALALVPTMAFAQTKPTSPTTVLTAGGCGGCHVIPGVPGATGEVGPDLSQIGLLARSRRTGYSAEKYLREAITNPDAFIAPNGTEDAYPSGVMLSAFEESLTKSDIDLIVEYLGRLGTESPPKDVPPRAFVREVAIPSESRAEPFGAEASPDLDPKQVILGRYLFFDKRLSANNSLSCASCHKPGNAFAGDQALSRGYPSTKLFRNVPTLLNAARQPELFHDGRIADLPSVIRDHLTESHFMAIDGRLLIERMRQVPEYVAMFREAFDAEPRFGKILNALTAYVSSLNSGPTPYDRFLAGDEPALSADAKAGLRIFRTKAGCVKCHSGVELSDHDYHNIGVPEADITADPELHVTFRRFFRLQGTPNYLNLHNDAGRFAMTLKERDRGRFRTPMLREVGRTGPYMHNGQLATLADVVAFYNQGGGAGQSADLKPLNLSKNEQQQLVAFLKSLSSEPVEVTEPQLPGYGNRPVSDVVKLAGPRQADSSPVSETFPPLAPLPKVPPAPLDNPITATKAELGKLLYFDPRMSADGSTSCNSCHASTTGWTIRTPVSMGSPGTSHWRNAQTVLNVAYYGKLNWDGAKSSIEKQNSGAWTGVVAGNLDPALGEERMAQIPDYVERFRNVFGTDLPRWPDALRAVATFQRTLNSTDTPFDRFANGDESAMTASAKRGFRLFNGKAACIQCHHGPLASDDSYHAIGVPQHPDFATSPLKQITFRYELASKGVSESEYTTSMRDEGLYYVTKRKADRGKFRTPSLRELVYTAPYMHNGVLATLEEVVEFYNNGGGAHPNLSSRLRPLNLTETERADLVEFLKALSGKPLVIAKPELPPYGRFSPEQ